MNGTTSSYQQINEHEELKHCVVEGAVGQTPNQHPNQVTSLAGSGIKTEEYHQKI